MMATKHVRYLLQILLMALLLHNIFEKKNYKQCILLEHKKIKIALIIFGMASFCDCLALIRMYINYFP